MSDMLTEELEALRRFRRERLEELMRNLEERRLASNEEPDMSGSMPSECGDPVRSPALARESNRDDLGTKSNRVPDGERPA